MGVQPGSVAMRGKGERGTTVDIPSDGVDSVGRRPEHMSLLRDGGVALRAAIEAGEPSHSLAPRKKTTQNREDLPFVVICTGGQSAL